MRKYFLLLFCVLPAFYMSANFGASAGGSLGSGNISVFGTSQVEMRSEDLKIDLFKGYARVSVTYEMVNPGKKVIVQAGFPSIILADPKSNMYGDKKLKAKDAIDIYKYRIVVNGKKIPYWIRTVGFIGWNKLHDYYYHTGGTAKKKKAWGYMLMSRIVFKAGEKKKIQISFLSKYQRVSGGTGSMSEYLKQYFTYLLATASVWKGPIKKGSIRIRVIGIPEKMVKIYPSRQFTKTGNSYIWNFQNLEPKIKHNIQVSIDNRYTQYLLFKKGEYGNLRGWYIIRGKKYYYDHQKFRIKASSTLKGYSAYSARDFKTKTAWVEGKKSAGIGEYLLLGLYRPAKLSHIGIIPGLAKNRKLYFLNNRVAEVKVVINNSFTVTKSFPDIFLEKNSYGPAAFYFVNVQKYGKKVRTVKIIITKVYKGSKYDDTCISEVLVRQPLRRKPESRGR